MTRVLIAAEHPQIHNGQPNHDLQSSFPSPAHAKFAELFYWGVALVKTVQLSCITYTFGSCFMASQLFTIIHELYEHRVLGLTIPLFICELSDVF